MWNGKNKAVTFSYDDSITQDKRLIKLFDKYGLKCTFNLNSGLLGQEGYLDCEGERVSFNHVKPEEVRELYAGHEIASHTLTHPALRDCSEEEIFRQVENDRLRLCELAGYEVVGFAYPGGTGCVGNSDKIIREKTGVKYARTTSSTYSFDLQDDLILFNPTVYHHGEWDALFSLGRKFLALDTDEPQLFYIWGHAFEFDIHDTWDRMEEFCRLISGKNDIFYGTNKEVLLER